MSPPRKAKALGIFSGGLDSILACKVLQRAGVEVMALTFTSPFFNADHARRSAAQAGIPLRVEPLGESYLDMVKEPPHGRGSNMNPCIDCHATMFRRAGRIMEAEGFDFLFSGEVLGQRPMSQNKQALAQVAKLSGYAGSILRPLSAKNLAVTAMEEQGLVDREMLLGLSGRSRKPQMALAAELGVSEYPAPAGGCLLTEPGFSNRLRDLWEHQPEAGAAEVELLKHGRHLRLSARAKLIVGRNQGDNQRLEKLATPQAVWLIGLDGPGPLGLYFGPLDSPELETAAGLVAGYGKGKPGQSARVSLSGGGELVVPVVSKREAAPLLL
ncbi:MAG: tRNA 4-thiouridine(8) synthase ThiI [Desulfarculaceae bacterium]|nr:tRNA 4-thiouridine(8) synthase ThiI [Desulfarculaceae bacterium]MCF8073843.1 tRNA 4-thiouridine(8) synthase ThiI [Desulfarculaceae bacterium]MCF8102823.1 tRNA 4-thiouridine(8) synthase ThiI [Desulfarculaceae bacterium]MCF8116267.1 tRNA 4-thiouridine(8) synthase ThiI [Desulfarculaceae bacterium]